MRTLKFLVLFCVISLGFTSCVSPDEQVKTIPLKGRWVSKYAAHFDFDITDAQNPKNIIFVVRNNNNYPYSNIRFFASITKIGDKNPVKVDTLNYVMAKPNGEWLGTGFGETKEILFLYKPDYHFPGNGKYKIEVKHAMRTNPLVGLEDIGIKIQTVKP